MEQILLAPVRSDNHQLSPLGSTGAILGVLANEVSGVGTIPLALPDKVSLKKVRIAGTLGSASGPFFQFVLAHYHRVGFDKYTGEEPTILRVRHPEAGSGGTGEFDKTWDVPVTGREIVDNARLQIRNSLVPRAAQCLWDVHRTLRHRHCRQLNHLPVPDGVFVDDEDHLAFALYPVLTISLVGAWDTQPLARGPRRPGRRRRQRWMQRGR